MPPSTQRILNLAGAAGLRVRAQDVESLSRWIEARRRKLELPEIADYSQLLCENSDPGRTERELLLTQFTTGESYFFRDQGQFDLLQAKILPELIERRARERRLRIWSAGCATGEEPYSLAMLVSELGPRLAGWDVLILGTDINSDALRKARRGLFREWSFRALDAERRRRCFEPQGGQWQLVPRLRDMASFRRLDLVRDDFPDAQAGLNDFDLILCRNVFIYLDTHAIKRITAKFAAALADGGYLITGHNELFGHDTAPLRIRLFAQSAVFQKSAQTTAEMRLGEALAKIRLPAIAAPPPAPRTGRPTSLPAQPATPAHPRPATPADCDQAMLSAWRYADRGMRDAAKEECRKVIALAGLDPRPYYLLALLAGERGDTMQAKSLLTKVIYLDPSFIAAYLELGSLHELTGKEDRARRMYETARTALRKLPADTALAPYSESTAADALAYVERLLDAPAARATRGPAKAVRPQASA